MAERPLHRHYIAARGNQPGSEEVAKVVQLDGTSFEGLVAVRGKGLIPGDSGGPAYYGNIAYGMTSGATNPEDPETFCTDKNNKKFSCATITPINGRLGTYKFYNQNGTSGYRVRLRKYDPPGGW